jgi:hypothetical protein
MFTPSLNKLSYELNYLSINNKIGLTGYIDFITVADMSHSIMEGTDCYNRSFIAIKINMVNRNNPEDKKQVVGTFFQRYTDDYRTLCYGTCYQQGTIFHSSYVASYDYEDLDKRLAKLLNNEVIYSYNSVEETDFVSGTGDYEITL